MSRKRARKKPGVTSLLADTVTAGNRSLQMKDHGNGVTRTVSIFPQDNSLPVIQGADLAKLSKTTCMSINSASVPDISYLQKIPFDGLYGKVSSLLKN